MKTNNYKKESRSMRFPYAPSIKSLILCAFFLVGIQAEAQDSIQYTKPSWYFGVAAGGNINFYRGSTQQLNATLTVPTTFHDGDGIGLFLAPLIEFRPANSRWGIMLQAGYDNRKGEFDQVKTPCNCPADLITDLSYLTVEPSLRFAPFKSNFYLYGGPRLAFNLTKSADYQLGLNPAYPDQAISPEVKGDFSDAHNHLISMQIGAGLDIPISKSKRRTQFVISPFVSFQPYFGQDPRSIETWNITTVRVGAALKLGSGHKIPTPINENLAIKNAMTYPEVNFAINSPENKVAEHRIKEIFPLRNYVFFDLGSTELPNRYVKLRKDEVSNFKETELPMPTAKNLSKRSERQMAVYYNVLNILGDRMVKNPNSTISLVGSSEQGTEDGRKMAESVKTYLITVFAIDANRITTEGRNRAVVASSQPNGTKELDLVLESDRRVTIETRSPALLMEFRSGLYAQFKPIEIKPSAEAPLSSYVTFAAVGAEKSFDSWSIEITDEMDKTQKFGPYSQDNVSLSTKSILGTRPVGNFNVKMIGEGKGGKTTIKESKVQIVLWKAPAIEDDIRFSVLYEFDDSKAISIYQNYLTEFVIPKIPIGGKVIIHGHTDIIGDATYNQRLSYDRANDVKNILEKGLKKTGRNDVQFEVHGYGEDEKTALFENKYPEERFYNRTVVIDIVQR